MSNGEAADTNAKPAEENAGGRTSEKPPFEIPECCRHMMTQMMGGSSCDLANGRDEQSAENGGDPPGILGRLMLRLMKSCCGRLDAKQSRAA